jgi:hypothetical protein
VALGAALLALIGLAWLGARHLEPFPTIVGAGLGIGTAAFLLWVVRGFVHP